MTHIAGGARIDTGGAPESVGEGGAFSATDLPAAALAGCVATSVASILERRGIPAGGLRVGVGKTLVSGPSRPTEMRVTVRIGAGVDDRLRRIVQRAAETCAVKRTLSPDLPVTTTVEAHPEL